RSPETVRTQLRMPLSGKYLRSGLESWQRGGRSLSFERRTSTMQWSLLLIGPRSAFYNRLFPRCAL
ncbi:MAG: hypothetical protein DMG88_18710, partial [Acidobacteria bacterium]